MRSRLARFGAPLVSSFASLTLGCDAAPPAPPAVHAVALTEVRLNLVAPVDFSLASLFQLRVAADPAMRHRIGTAARASVVPHRLDTAADAYVAAIRSRLVPQA